MEEILSSIRRIISEDGNRPADAAPGPAPVAPQPSPPPKPELRLETKPAPAVEDDVLVLTEMVPDEPIARVAMPPAPPAPPPPIIEEPAPLPEPPAPVAAEPEPITPEPEPYVPEPEPVVLPEPPQPDPEPEPVAIQQQPIAEPVRDARLMSQETELASAAALSILGQLIDPERKLNEEGRQMIEAAARDKIVPLLREWMDANLAQLIRELVREEIQRVMARAFGKEV